MKFLTIMALPVFLTACVATPRENENIKQEERVLPAEVGAYTSEQEKDLRQILDDTSFKVIRYKNILALVFSGPDAFAKNSAEPTPALERALEQTAVVLSLFDKTRIAITGYTEQTGKQSQNQILSAKRADTVASILENAASIADIRFWFEGRGTETTSLPKINNDAVEIILTPTIR